MRDHLLRPLLAKMALFGSLFGIGLLVWITNLLAFRTSYSRLRDEHNHMKYLYDQGDENVRSASGDSIGDMFEYVSMARKEYLDALEFVLLFGALPAMLLWFVIAFRGSTRSYLRSGEKSPEDKQTR
ncbi:hypothetical protein IHQ71_18935 [Rhizobium sp. TH2]|uniref:hypothetical protein n=1 Tax=Rhizobium sp. TH2 TaxID=2775403 RepID=UPI0021580992|nr:hypothetical protein [Rhizobium sp. TH2]UVC07279.1 hypothetical protein IHQ71_18935 [Rhizobium sp. TH2]